MKEYITNTVFELRRIMHITQEEFAHEVGVSRQTVIAIEKGNYIPSLLLAMKIARFFKRSVDEVFTYSYEK